MTANELKQLSYDSVKKEIADVEAILKKDAGSGQLKSTIDKISDAARLYFTERGFKYKIHLEPGKEIGTSNQIILSWE